MRNKVNPNIVKLTSLAVINNKIEFVYKFRNDSEFELRFEEKLLLHDIEKFICLEDLGKIKINVEHNRVSILFNEELANILYRLKEDYESSRE